MLHRVRERNLPRMVWKGEICLGGFWLGQVGLAINALLVRLG